MVRKGGGNMPHRVTVREASFTGSLRGMVESG